MTPARLIGWSLAIACGVSAAVFVYVVGCLVIFATSAIG